MKKEERKIPEGIRYLSDWDGFNDLPKHQHYVLDKKMCNCGATEAYIRSSNPIILAMPRKHLLYNKYSQHPTEVFLYRFLNKKQYFSDKTPSVEEMKEFDRLLIYYIENGGTKILATYDSLPKITNILLQQGKNLSDYDVVVDEFQQIIADAPYKADTEHQFYKALKKYDTVVYLSATPFLEEYLDRLNQFKDLPFIELVWPEKSEIKAEIKMEKLTKSITKKCCEIIRQYQDGDVPYEVIDGQRVESKEAVFFLNDVKAIINVIKESGLEPGDVNILCAPRRENYDRIAALNKGCGVNDPKFEKGEIPGKGDKHKKFTMCTSSVYIGADFYSESAYAYIFANPNVESLTIDVGVDIQQIIGRQRLDKNPFRLKANLYYSLKKPLITEQEMNDIIEEKKKETNRQIENYKASPHKASFIKSIESLISKGHKDQYCCISEDDKGNKIVEENPIIEVAEKRAWDIANKVYKGDFSLFKALQKNADVTRDVDSTDPDVRKIFEIWSKDGQFKRQAMLYCELKEKQPDLLDKCTFIPKYFHDYHEALGRKGFEDLKWRRDYIKAALAPTPLDLIPHELVVAQLKTRFIVGQEYTKEDVKKGLIEIYKALGIKGKPTATDIKRYFTVEESSKRINKKKTATFKIVVHCQKIVTLFDHISNVKKPEWNGNIDQILELIKTGDRFNLKHRVENVRMAKTDAERANWKSKLPAVTWNGQFSYRDSNGCTNYSSFTALDFDHVNDMDALRDWLRTLPCVYAYFDTPSGKGIKAIIQHDNLRPENHGDLYDQLIKVFACNELDTSTLDLPRGHYLSYDPGLWLNPNVEPFHYEPRPYFQPRVFVSQTVVKDESTGDYIMEDNDSEVAKFLYKLNFQIISDESIINILRKTWTQKSIVRGRNLSVFSYAGILCKAGVDEKLALNFIKTDLVKDLPEDEINRTVRNAYEHNVFGCDRRRYTKHKK